MKKNQEQWVDDILGSLQGMQAAEGNPHLHTRVMARLQQQLPDRQPVQLKWVYAMAGIFTIMLLLNVLGWSNNSSKSTTGVDIETVLNEYNTDNSYTSLP
ncbi:hypothetical protein IQ13_1944 [Lacibacter cauensis]|uniref:Uncharacterized protein n=1 Tax=Lacibacter cauensis TaxID=510947 RepID=A0A562SSP3_9BACT|nr:hypothetical protein [Lacibacter cauensis]TWI83826.1 hypothetical protein IQ13_1944 [Lacibacter cauensis]